MILEPSGTGKYREETVLRQPGYWGPFNPETGWALPNVSPTPGTLAHPLAGSSTRNNTQLRSQVSEQFWTLRYRGLSATPPPVSSGTLTHPTEVHPVLTGA